METRWSGARNFKSEYSGVSLNMPFSDLMLWFFAQFVLVWCFFIFEKQFKLLFRMHSWYHQPLCDSVRCLLAELFWLLFWLCKYVKLLYEKKLFRCILSLLNSLPKPSNLYLILRMEWWRCDLRKDESARKKNLFLFLLKASKCVPSASSAANCPACWSSIGDPLENPA